MLLDSGANDNIVRSMQSHMYDADAQLYACWALVEIAAEDGDGQHTRGSAFPSPLADDRAEGSMENNVIDAIIYALQRHRKDANVNRYGAKALENLALRSGWGS